MNDTEVPPPGEGSMIGRFVAVITPFIALLAGWVSGVVANNVPGVKLEKSEVVAFMVAVVTSVLTSAWKWLQGFQQHEAAVANRLVAPMKVPNNPKLQHKPRAACVTVPLRREV